MSNGFDGLNLNSALAYAAFCKPMPKFPVPTPQPPAPPALPPPPPVVVPPPVVDCPPPAPPPPVVVQPPAPAPPPVVVCPPPPPVCPEPQVLPPIIKNCFPQPPVMNCYPQQPPQQCFPQAPQVVYYPYPVYYPVYYPVPAQCWPSGGWPQQGAAAAGANMGAQTSGMMSDVSQGAMQQAPLAQSQSQGGLWPASAMLNWPQAGWPQMGSAPQQLQINTQPAMSAADAWTLADTDRNGTLNRDEFNAIFARLMGGAGAGGQQQPGMIGTAYPGGIVINNNSTNTNNNTSSTPSQTQSQTQTQAQPQTQTQSGGSQTQGSTPSQTQTQGGTAPPTQTQGGSTAGTPTAGSGASTPTPGSTAPTPTPGNTTPANPPQPGADADRVWREADALGAGADGYIDNDAMNKLLRDADKDKLDKNGKPTEEIILNADEWAALAKRLGMKATFKDIKGFEDGRLDARELEAYFNQFDTFEPGANRFNRDEWDAMINNRVPAKPALSSSGTPSFAGLSPYSALMLPGLGGTPTASTTALGTTGLGTTGLGATGLGATGLGTTAASLPLSMPRPTATPAATPVKMPVPRVV